MYPENLLYTKEHEWVKKEGEIAVIGITDYAQHQLGDIVYVELPEVEAQVKQFEVCGTIESVKTVSELYAPISGEVVKINDALDDKPELLNEDPYGAGWIVEIRCTNPGDLTNLLSAKDYEAILQ